MSINLTQSPTQIGMAGNIQLRAATGLTLYFPVIQLDGKWWNVGTYRPEVMDPSTWSAYVNTLIEIPAGSGAYFGKVPPNLYGATFLLPIYQQASTSPVSTDIQLTAGRSNLTLAMEWDNTVGLKSLAPLGHTPGPSMQIPAAQDSLAFAQQMLGRWLDAEANFATAGLASVTIDGEQTIFLSPDGITKKIEYWRNRVNLLSGARRRVASIRMDQF